MSYSSEVLADTPAGYWKLDETSGTTAADSSGNSHSLTITGSPTLSVSPLINAGTAITFSGSGQYIGNISTVSGINANGKVTLEAWIQTTQSGAGTPMIFAADDSGGANGERYFQLRISTTNKVEFAVFDNGGVGHGGYLSNTTINDGVKHHIVCTYDSSQIKIYVDGVLDMTPASLSITLASGPATNLQIANRYSTGSHQNLFNGTIDEVAIYTDALTSTRVAAHYSAGTATILADSGTVTIALTPSSSDTSDKVDATTEIFALKPSSADSSQFVDNNTLRLSLTPSGADIQTSSGTAYTDANTERLSLTPSSSDVAATSDAATARLGLTPSSTDVHTTSSFTVYITGDRVIGATLTAHTGDPPIEPSLNAPSLINISFSGNIVTLTYDMPLATNAPSTSQFTVTDNGVTVGVFSASASGSTVTLTLATSIGPTDILQVAYSAAGGTKIQNTYSVFAAAFAAMNAFNASTSGDLYMVQITRRGVLINTYAGENLHFTLNKQPPHTAEWEVSHSHPGVTHDFIRPRYHDFLIIKGDTPILAGPVTDFGVAGSDEFSAFAGKDWSERLDWRHYPFNPNNPHPPAAFPGGANDFVIGTPPQGLAYQAFATDVAEIIRTLLDNVFARPNSLKLFYPTLTTNLGIPTNFELPLADNTTMKSIIESLSDIYPGFQWEVLWTRELRLYSPNKYGGGVVPASTSDADIAAAVADCNFALINDPSVIDVRFGNTGPGATHYLGTGSGKGGGRLGSAITYPAAEDVDTGYGRIDGTEDFGDEPNRQHVVDRTRRSFAKAVNPQHEIEVDVDPDIITDFWILASPGSAIWLDEDLVSHRIQSPQEIVMMDCKPNDEGDMVVTMGLNQIYNENTAFTGTEEA